MRLVVIESPYAGDVERNVRYLAACLADCIRRGEAPFASHAIYPAVCNDNDPEQRKLGIDAGFAWGQHADAVVFYTDLGFSRGMVAARDHYRRIKVSRPINGIRGMGHHGQVEWVPIPIEDRELGGEWGVR